MDIVTTINASKRDINSIVFTILPWNIMVKAGDLFWSCVPQGTQAVTMGKSFRVEYDKL